MLDILRHYKKSLKNNTTCCCVMIKSVSPQKAKSLYSVSFVFFSFKEPFWFLELFSWSWLRCKDKSSKNFRKEKSNFHQPTNTILPLIDTIRGPLFFFYSVCTRLDCFFAFQFRSDDGMFSKVKSVEFRHGQIEFCSILQKMAQIEWNKYFLCFIIYLERQNEILVWFWLDWQLWWF
jgi:hypothetical protein